MIVVAGGPQYRAGAHRQFVTMARKLGLRKLEWLVEKDEIDHSFKVRINGRDISMFGANWIPADAIPSRITPDTDRSPSRTAGGEIGAITSTGTSIDSSV